MTDLQAGIVLLSLVVVVWALMWWGWRRRATRHELPPLAPVPDTASETPALLEGAGRYYGSTVAGNWLERVTARGLGARSNVRLRLTADGLDVDRAQGPFRIPVEALLGARHDQGLAGKVVPPHGLLVVTWQHADLRLDTGFRLSDETTQIHGITETHDRWVTTIDQLATRQEDVE